MSWIDNIFKKKIKPGSYGEVDNRAIQQLLNGQGITTNQEARDRDYVEQGYQLNPTVYSIISHVQSAAEGVKWDIYKKDGNKDATGRFANPEKANNVLLEALMERPNGWMNWKTLVNEFIGFYMLQGDGYLWGITPETNSPLTRGTYNELWVLPSQHVQIHADNMKGVAGYSLDYYTTGSSVEMEVGDVMHIKNFNPEYDEDASFLYGQSPLRALIRSLRTNNDGIDTQRAYLLNQGPKGILTAKPDGMVNFDQDAAEKLRNKFRRNNQGTRKAGDILITPNEFTWQKVGMSATDIELLDTMHDAERMICNAYNFPHQLLIGDSKFSNRSEYKRALWNDLIIPYLSKFRDELNCWLVPKYGDGIYIDFDLSNVPALQEDIEKQAQALSKMDWLTANEKRQMMGLMPLTDPMADQYIPSTLGGDVNGGNNSNTENPPEDGAEV